MVLLFQVKGVGKCGYYRLWKEGMEDEDEEEEKTKKEVRYVQFKYGRTWLVMSLQNGDVFDLERSTHKSL